MTGDHPYVVQSILHPVMPVSEKSYVGFEAGRPWLRASHPAVPTGVWIPPVPRAGLERREKRSGRRANCSVTRAKRSGRRANCSVVRAKSSATRANCSVARAKSSVTRANCSVARAKSFVARAKSFVARANSSALRAKSSVTRAKSSAAQKSPADEALGFTRRAGWCSRAPGGALRLADQASGAASSGAERRR